ncbi:hypothetical protein [Phaeovulum sp.]|uniref:hypothetical protein n=1 Tax=Phaeovulum sp. TaxID=2934796 RepID=UPI0039E40B4A
MPLPLRPLALALPLLALASTATAEGDSPLPMTYAMFEAGVPHIDMALCPEPLDGPDRFCRLTVANDQINVFVFTTEGDSPMVAFQSWSADLFAGLLD